MFRDGPLRRRPPEEIRYGTGKCALGLVLVALSDKGIVTIMVRDAQARLLRDLRARFPKAELIHDEKGCAPVVKKVSGYIAAPMRRFDLSLDIRGTELQKRPSARPPPTRASPPPSASPRPSAQSPAPARAAG